MLYPVYTACLGAEAVAATTAYVLVDLSDTTNFPHAKSGELHLLGLSLCCNIAGDGVYDIWVGVISEVDASNGTAEWFEVFHMESIVNPTDSTGYYDFVRDYTFGGINPEGMNLQILSGASTYLVTNQSLAGNAAWQTDVGLASPVGAAAGATGKPGAGDCVVYVEEVSGSGTIDFSLTAFYSAV